MFKFINKQGVKSDLGYEFQRIHRFYYHYIENDHVLKVDVEPSLNSEELFLGANPTWEAPHASEKICAEKIPQIEKRICDALKFMGIRHKLYKS